MRRLRLTLTILSALVAAFFLPCWLWHHHFETHHHVSLGRGYRTLELHAAPNIFELGLITYATPLTRQHPDALFLRTRGYGWFAGDSRQQRLDLGDLCLVREETDYGSHPGIFMTSWAFDVPYWLALLATSVLPACWLKCRIAPGPTLTRVATPD